MIATIVAAIDLDRGQLWLTATPEETCAQEIIGLEESLHGFQHNTRTAVVNRG